MESRVMIGVIDQGMRASDILIAAGKAGIEPAVVEEPAERTPMMIEIIQQEEPVTVLIKLNSKTQKNLRRGKYSGCSRTSPEA